MLILSVRNNACYTKEKQRGGCWASGGKDQFHFDYWCVPSLTEAPAERLFPCITFLMLSFALICCKQKQLS